ncbi:MAG TPA: nucleotide disphospho-sugar-binding domain-containing protein [Pseudonocardiaceae bacterium]|nr:nucleotide disphospho-sugar-binding domain-containing protein [Pseudonocardiaceae bacterium]
MRVLITSSPGLGHVFPTVSTAWALRAAGHDVILATGGHHDLAAHAGLQVVDTAPGVDSRGLTVPADFVVTLGGAPAADFGPLPDNVRLVEWVPLGALLAASTAAIHHGGAGTTLTALNAGLPQLVLPQGADQFMNAAAVAKSGTGAVVTPDELDADRLADLLADGPMRAAAQGVAAEMAGQPSPADLVSRIIELAT